MFPFLFPTHGMAPAHFAYRVNFVYKNYARRLFFGLGEKVTNASRTDSHEHFHEFRTCYGKKRNLCFSCHSPGQKRFSRTRRPHKENPLGYLGSKFYVALRLFEKEHHFL